MLEIAIVLLIIGIVMAMVGTTTAAYVNQKRRTETQDKLKTIDAAIVNFVALQKRLPCPADGTINSLTGSANAGVENCAPLVTVNNQANGVVPWTTLGLSLADGTDSWGNVFTYRVDTYSYTAGTMNFTNCTGAGTAGIGSSPAFCKDPNSAPATCPTANVFPGCYTSTLDATVGHGLRVKNLQSSQVTIADPASSTGAAYILISHGENGEGAYTPAGTLITSGSTTSGTEEQRNFANTAYVVATSYLVDDIANYNGGTSHFDDFVSRPSLLAVAGKATLGPRQY